jgi:DNA-binding NarL/FixJ family response regulator
MARQTSTQRHTLALLDAHHVLREALGHWLVANGPYCVAWSGVGVEELMAALDAGLCPALVLVALRPPEENGFQALERLKAGRPQLPCAAYAYRRDDATVLRAYRNGAQALLHEELEPGVALQALPTVMQGAVVHTPDTQRVLLENPDGLTPEERRRKRLLKEITARELEVLEAVVKEPDQTSTTLGERFRISARTVESHIGSLFRTFGVSSRMALIVAAIRVGVVRV